jgi:hypothetical protein
LDPFADGRRMETRIAQELVRPRPAHQSTMQMLNNLVPAYHRRGDLSAAIHAATMRLVLPAEASRGGIPLSELRAMRARLN